MLVLYLVKYSVGKFRLKEIGRVCERFRIKWTVSFQDKEAGEVHVYINSSTKCGVLDEASRIVLERVDIPKKSENVRRFVAA